MSAFPFSVLLVTLALGLLTNAIQVQPNRDSALGFLESCETERCVAVKGGIERFKIGDMTIEELAALRESVRVLSQIGATRLETSEAARILEELNRVPYTQDEAEWAANTLRRIAQPVQRAPSSNLLFSDDFTTLNHTTWEHEVTMGGGGNWEFQVYVNNRTNSYVRDGILYLKPTLTSDWIGENSVVNGGILDLSGDTHSYSSCTDPSFYGCSRSSNGANIINPIKSAAIKTIQSFSFKYGKLEIRAKLPRGDWIWPAIWLLPKQDAYGKWPASGEIDLVESRGNANGYPEGADCFASTLHFGPFYPLDPWDKAHASSCLPKGYFSDDFHVFGMMWDQDRIITYLDDETNVVLNVTTSSIGSFWKLGGFADNLANPWTSGAANAPFDQEFFIKFNVAVGGVNSYFPDDVGNKPWSTKSGTAMLDFWNAKSQWYSTWKEEDAAMQIDWVRVYSA